MEEVKFKLKFKPEYPILIGDLIKVPIGNKGICDQYVVTEIGDSPLSNPNELRVSGYDVKDKSKEPGYLFSLDSYEDYKKREIIVHEKGVGYED